MPNTKTTLLLIISIFYFQSVFASHIVGGDMTVNYTGDENSYSIDLNLYYDEVNGAGLFLIPITTKAYIYEKSTDKLVKSVLIRKKTNTTVIPLIEPTCATPTYVKTRIIRFRGIVDLPADQFDDPDGYYIVYYDCCRNENISNVDNADSYNMIFYSEFPNSSLKNSSPVLSSPFGEQACVGSTFTYDLSAEDINGDSVSYHIVQPYGNTLSFSNTFPAPYDEIVYNTQVFGPQSSDLNPITGLFSYTPSLQGIYLFTIEYREYRNGVQIGLVRRDFQIVVTTSCELNTPPEITLYDQNFDLLHDNDSLFFGPKDTKCFWISVKDTLATNISELYITTLSESNLSIANTTTNISINNQDSALYKVCIDTCEDSDGYDLFTFIVRDRGCPIPLYDSSHIYINSEKAINQTPTVALPLTEDTLTLTLGQDTSFTVSANEDDGQNYTLFLENYNHSDQDKYGINFDQVSGTNELNSEFYIQTNCDGVLAKYLTMNFRSEESFCNEKYYADTSVVLEIIDAAFIKDGFVPQNVFTPNGDGVNDYFEYPDLPIPNCEYVFQHITLFNRWGNVVFTTTDTNFKFDGSHLSEGLYYYHIEYTNHQYKGWIQVLK